MYVRPSVRVAGISGALEGVKFLPLRWALDMVTQEQGKLGAEGKMHVCVHGRQRAGLPLPAALPPVRSARVLGIACMSWAWGSDYGVIDGRSTWSINLVLCQKENSL